MSVESLFVDLKAEPPHFRKHLRLECCVIENLFDVGLEEIRCLSALEHLLPCCIYERMGKGGQRKGSACTCRNHRFLLHLAVRILVQSK